MSAKLKWNIVNGDEKITKSLCREWRCSRRYRKKNLNISVVFSHTKLSELKTRNIFTSFGCSSQQPTHWSLHCCRVWNGCHRQDNFGIKWASYCRAAASVVRKSERVNAKSSWNVNEMKTQESNNLFISNMNIHKMSLSRNSIRNEISIDCHQAKGNNKYLLEIFLQ